MALHNIQQICPSFAPILINTYQSALDLFIAGDTQLFVEGTTQGDPLAMPMYALATLPLIKCISGGVAQVWYAYYACAYGSTLIMVGTSSPSGAWFWLQCEPLVGH